MRIDGAPRAVACTDKRTIEAHLSLSRSPALSSVVEHHFYWSLSRERGSFMEKLSNLQQKKGKGKKKPVKVVYISNPMRVTTSASQFRALVQELTGQDSDPPLETANFSPAESRQDYSDHQQQLDVGESDVVPAAAAAPVERNNCPPPSAIAPAAASEQARSFGESYELLEEAFTPQMMEGFNGFNGFFPSSLLHESDGWSQ